MIIECPKCQTKYTLDEKTFQGQTLLQARCKKCQHSFSVNAPAMAAQTQAAQTNTQTSAVPPSRPRTAPAEEATIVSKIGTGGGKLPEGKTIALSVTNGPQTGRVYRLRKAQVLIGRLGAGADVIIEDPEVSRKHCALYVNGATAILTDLGTTNGTYVEGCRIATHELNHLSEFRIGNTTLMFTVTNAETVADANQEK